VTTWDVSEKSTVRMQMAWSLVNIRIDD
jgi:hypothetical protein